MSYCRMGEDSDVYMFHHIDGFIKCFACRLKEGYTSVRLESPEEALAHLAIHIENGHKVPQYAIDRLVWETEE